MSPSPSPIPPRYSRRSRRSRSRSGEELRQLRFRLRLRLELRFQLRLQRLERKCDSMQRAANAMAEETERARVMCEGVERVALHVAHESARAAANTVRVGDAVLRLHADNDVTHDAVFELTTALAVQRERFDSLEARVDSLLVRAVAQSNVKEAAPGGGEAPTRLVDTGIHRQRGAGFVFLLLCVLPLLLPWAWGVGLLRCDVNELASF